MAKRPYRRTVFTRITDEIEDAANPTASVLEIGSGPGFLAEQVLTWLRQTQLTLLDFSEAMHALAQARLGAAGTHVTFLTRDFKEAGWSAGLGPFDCVVTIQAVHELRHKRHAPALHAAIRGLLAPQGSYLVCDHYCGDGGMRDDRLFMTIDEQRDALYASGFETVERLCTIGSLVLHRARLSVNQRQGASP